MDLRRNLEIDLTITHEARGWYGSETTLHLVKRTGESFGHVAMKLLGYLLFFDPELAVEPTVDQRYKPDLARFGDRGRPIEWVECGKVAPRKLDRVVRRNDDATVAILKETPRKLDRFERAVGDLAEAERRVRGVAFEPGVVTDWADALERRHRLTAVVPPGQDHLFADLDGRSRRTAVTWQGRSDPP